MDLRSYQKLLSSIHFLQKKFSRIRKESAQDKWDYCIWNFYNDITYTLVKVKATLDNNIRSSKVSGNFDPRSVPFAAIVWALWFPKSYIFCISWDARFRESFLTRLWDAHFSCQKCCLIVKSYSMRKFVPHLQEKLAFLDEFSMY